MDLKKSRGRTFLIRLPPAIYSVISTEEDSRQLFQDEALSAQERIVLGNKGLCSLLRVLHTAWIV